MEEHGEEHDQTRRFERVPVALPAMGWAPQFQGTALSGMVRYLSEGGLMVEFPVELIRGTRVRVVLPTFQGPLEVEGEIVWTASHGSVIRHGLAFPEPEGPDFIPRVVGEKR
jgi:PilZ domain-containing protein